MARLILHLLMCLIVISCAGKETPNGDGDLDNSPVDVLSFGYVHSCVGCAANQVSTKLGDMKKIYISAWFQHEESYFGISNFFIGRLYRKIQQLQMDSCRIFSPNLLPEITDPKLDCYNDGIIKIEASWEGWKPITLKYLDVAEGYPDLALWGKVTKNYKGGQEIVIISDGSQDLGGFTAHLKSISPIELLSPSTDLNGITVNVSQNAPLEISWSGGESESVWLWIHSQWIDSGGKDSYLGCHILNDGSFTIPKKLIEDFDWANHAELAIRDQKHVNLGIKDIPGAQIETSVLAYILINYDPDATPAVNPSGVMSDGFVGNRCKDDSECGGGQCFFDDTFRFGYCSISGCKDSKDCPNDANCFLNETNNIPSITYWSFCAKKCTDDKDCRVDDNYQCIKEGCIPAVW